MKEDFLHYLWRFQKFSKSDLRTTTGETIQVLKPGFFNASDAGPDFSQAHIKINQITWVGHVEVHVRSSDWRRHGHELDAAYDNVILHVVWIDDEPLRDISGQAVPTLELQGIADPDLEQRYHALMASTHTILCRPYLAHVRDITKLGMYDAALSHRLEQKVKEILAIYESCNQDWSQTSQVWLFRHFGFRINAEPMERLGRMIPWKLFSWHQHSPIQVEALLFGMAGLIPASEEDAYVQSLRAEFDFLAGKYGLKDKRINPSAWRMLRLRPANFPALRLAQLAAYLGRQPQTNILLEAFPKLEVVDSALAASVTDYWKKHYHFGKVGDRVPEKMGQASRRVLIANVVVPLSFALGKTRGEEAFIDQALDFLKQLPAERNRITKEWQDLGFDNQQAYDSQALIGLYRHFCEQRQCLQCKIGTEILRNQP